MQKTREIRNVPRASKNDWPVDNNLLNDDSPLSTSNSELRDESKRRRYCIGGIDSVNDAREKGTEILNSLGFFVPPLTGVKRVNLLIRVKRRVD